jgi:hypothetical protein
LDAKLNALKAMVDNAMAFFFLGESSSGRRAPQMLDSLLTRSREIILANMKQLASLALDILKSLYPQVDFNTVGEGFTATYSNEEALRLVENSVVMVGHIMDMVRVDMSLG